jgi:hypothetical protein
MGLAFVRRWLDGDQITRHSQWVLNSFLPPFPDPAFDRMFENLLSGRRLSPVSAFLAVSDACPYRPLLRAPLHDATVFPRSLLQRFPHVTLTIRDPTASRVRAFHRTRSSRRHAWKENGLWGREMGLLARPPLYP